MAFSISDLPPHMQRQAIQKLKDEDSEKVLMASGSGSACHELMDIKSNDLSKNDRSKYHSLRKTVVLPDGTERVFDSRKEARRYEELLLLEQSGDISGLRLQVKFVLIPTQREPDTTGMRGGIKKGKLLEKECSYWADFVYMKDGETVVEDVKSPATRTPVYALKRKLMLYIHGIKISEV